MRWPTLTDVGGLSWSSWNLKNRSGVTNRCVIRLRGKYARATPCRANSEAPEDHDLKRCDRCDRVPGPYLEFVVGSGLISVGANIRPLFSALQDMTVSTRPLNPNHRALSYSLVFTVGKKSKSIVKPSTDMSTTSTLVAPPEAQYEYYFRDGTNENKREILTGDKAVETFEEIPVIDVGKIYSENLEERRQKAEEVANVCKTVGFMYIKNHGISQDLIDEVFELSRKYHDQPLEVKMKEDVYKSETLRGYEVHYTKTSEGEKGENPDHANSLSRELWLSPAQQSRKDLSSTVMTQTTTHNRRNCLPKSASYALASTINGQKTGQSSEPSFYYIRPSF